MRSRSAYHGFTLVELLVVIAIIAMLVGLLLPAVGAARESGRRTQCANNLRQQGIALTSFHSAQQKYPSGSKLLKVPRRTGLSWHVYLLPYIEQQPIYDLIGPQPDGSGNDRSVWSTEIPTYTCPSGPTFGGNKGTHYSGVSGAGRDGFIINLEDQECGDIYTDGILYPDSQITQAHIHDGLSNTLIVGERSYIVSGRSPWTAGVYWIIKDRQIGTISTKNVRWPINASHQLFGYFNQDPNATPDGKTMLLNDLIFGSDHPGGAQFVAADGSVSFKANDLDLECFRRLATIDGGEVNCE